MSEAASPVDESRAALEKHIAGLKAEASRCRQALVSIVKRADDGAGLLELRHIATDALERGQVVELNRRRDSVERILLDRPWQERGQRR